VAITDAGPNSLRGYIERNSIALLSNFERVPLDPPSPSWLGLHSDRERISSTPLRAFSSIQATRLSSQLIDCS
jgi:hypothetical protein